MSCTRRDALKEVSIMATVASFPTCLNTVDSKLSHIGLITCPVRSPEGGVQQGSDRRLQLYISLRECVHTSLRCLFMCECS